MKKAIGLVGVAVLVCSAATFADDTHISSKGGTMARALEAVGENAAKNPGNPGLPNAGQHLLENAQKHQERRETHSPTAERSQGVDRVERAARPDRPERVERPDRPERPDHVVRVDRPEPPGRAKK